MTPKEKSNELIKNFDTVHYVELSNGKKFPVSKHNDTIIKDAIVCVK